MVMLRVRRVPNDQRNHRQKIGFMCKHRPMPMESIGFHSAQGPQNEKVDEKVDCFNFFFTSFSFFFLLLLLPELRVMRLFPDRVNNAAKRLR